ncbi:major facilitator superfamily domain-containing protein [Xylariaceae sp. FL0255]|nr:major facilitator superfamily domain-containing protein [Xylariaceae sp. FL0255]
MAFILQRRALRKLVQHQLEQIPNAKDQGLLSESTTGNNSTTDIESFPPTIEDFSQDPYLSIPGIMYKVDPHGKGYLEVGWTDKDDSFNPKCWSLAHRLRSTLLICLVALTGTIASSIDSVISDRAAADFGVSSTVESLATAFFLGGFGAGALLASPLSELVGRFPVYLVSLAIFAGWTVGSALSPNIAAQIVFRFLMGLTASPVLTVAGGSISDMWSPLERTFAYPVYAVPGFGGAVLGPVIGTWVGRRPNMSWRWVEWTVLILIGLSFASLSLLMSETFPPRILKIKAKAFRKLTDDARFKTSTEASDSSSVRSILKRNFMRPFFLCFEPIVISFTVYLSIAYTILFTFLDGYHEIFANVYDIDENLSNTSFVGILAGILLSSPLIPWAYHWTVKQLRRDGDDGSGSKLHRESRLIFAMIGAPFLPIGLFWMGWTDFAWISIWSPLAASALIGFSIICIFMSANLYIIDSYEMYAASALTFNSLARYISASGFTVIGIPLYGNLGTHYTLTILGIISTLAVPIPYVLYKWGPILRARSTWASHGR